MSFKSLDSRLREEMTTPGTPQTHLRYEFQAPRSTQYQAFRLESRTQCWETNSLAGRRRDARIVVVIYTERHNGRATRPQQERSSFTLRVLRPDLRYRYGRTDCFNAWETTYGRLQFLFSELIL